MPARGGQEPDELGVAHRPDLVVVGYLRLVVKTREDADHAVDPPVELPARGRLRNRAVLPGYGNHVIADGHLAGGRLRVGILAIDLLKRAVAPAGGPGSVRAADEEWRVALQLDMARMGFRDDEEVDLPRRARGEVIRQDDRRDSPPREVFPELREELRFRLLRRRFPQKTLMSAVISTCHARNTSHAISGSRPTRRSSGTLHPCGTPSRRPRSRPLSGRPSRGTCPGTGQRARPCRRICSRTWSRVPAPVPGAGRRPRDQDGTSTSRPGELAEPGASGCLLAVVATHATRVLPGVLGAEGIGDALVGGTVLAVDAVGVDLEQHRDAVPGAAGDYSHGHAASSQLACPTWTARAGTGVAVKASLRGRLRNTALPKTRALLPLFEAVVNAIQAVERGTR